METGGSTAGPEADATTNAEATTNGAEVGSTGGAPTTETAGGELDCEAVDDGSSQSLAGLDGSMDGPDRFESIDNPLLPPEAVAAFIDERMVPGACVDPASGCC